VQYRQHLKPRAELSFERLMEGFFVRTFLHDLVENFRQTYFCGCPESAFTG
jgi:hypothetical protein